MNRSSSGAGLIPCRHQGEHDSRDNDDPNGDQHKRGIVAKHSRHGLPLWGLCFSLIPILVGCPVAIRCGTGEPEREGPLKVL
jgi:hypothetical protein